MEIIEIARMQNEIECYLKGCVHGYIERGLLTMGFTQYQIDHAIGKGWLKVLSPGQTVHDWEMGVSLESSAVHHHPPDQPTVPPGQRLS